MGNPLVSWTVTPGSFGRKEVQLAGTGTSVTASIQYANSVAHGLWNRGGFDLARGMRGLVMASTADRGTGPGGYWRGRPHPGASVDARTSPVAWPGPGTRREE